MPADRPPLASRGSKSRLSKQAEVESEDPPHSNAAKIPIPETRVESFEMASDSVDSNQSPLLKNKVLVRSHAMCGDDDTKLKARALEKQCSSKSGSATSSLSRDSSNEMYTDSTGINLADFIATTLHKNAKDRQMLLQLEEELRKFVLDKSKQVQKFPPMSSYNRMLVHRISAFFGLNHNVDQNGTAVVVNKTSQTRLPDIEFAHYIRSDRFTDEPKRYLRRDVQSYEEQPTTAAADYLTVRGDGGLLEYRKARSFEVCEDDHRTGRFLPQDSTSSTDGVMESPMSGYSSENYVEAGVARPWSSTDSHSSSLDVPHGVMQKACSFAGVSAYRHGDSWHHPRPPPPSRRSNTCDSSRADMSPAMGRQPSIPEGSVIGASPVHLSAAASPQPMTAAGPPVIFAVANLDQVPPGAMILNPHTGQPYVTAQGTVYRYNPYAPVPAGVVPAAPAHLQQPATSYGQMMQVDVSGLTPHMQAMTIGPASPAEHPPPFTPHVYTYVIPHMPEHQPPSGQPSPGHHVYVPVQPQYIHGGVPIHYQQQPMTPAGVQCYLPTGPAMCSPGSAVDEHTQVTYAPTSGTYQTYSTTNVAHYVPVPSGDHVSTAGSGSSSDQTVEKSDESAASHESQQGTTTVNS